LYSLHFVWARTLGKRAQYEQARLEVIIASGKGAMGLSDAGRSQPVSKGGNAIQSSIIEQWIEVDRIFENDTRDSIGS
jgi:hypothetical protein